MGGAQVVRYLMRGDPLDLVFIHRVKKAGGERDKGPSL
jgi:hypothetical protein